MMPAITGGSYGFKGSNFIFTLSYCLVPVPLGLDVFLVYYRLVCLLRLSAKPGVFEVCPGVGV